MILDWKTKKLFMFWGQHSSQECPEAGLLGDSQSHQAGKQYSPAHTLKKMNKK